MKENIFKVVGRWGFLLFLPSGDSKHLSLRLRSPTGDAASGAKYRRHDLWVCLRLC